MTTPPKTIRMHITLQPPMTSPTWDPLAISSSSAPVSVNVPVTSTLKHVTDICTSAVDAGGLSSRQAHYLYMTASMPRNSGDSVHVPIECESAWCHFKSITNEMSLVVRTELRSNVFPSRFFTIADLVRYTRETAVTSWRPPQTSLPTLVHSNIDTIRRKQFHGSVVHLIVPSCITLEPGGMDGMAGSVLFGSASGVHTAQFANCLLTHVTISKPTTHVHMRALSGSRLRTASFPPTLQHIGASSFKGTLLTLLDLSKAISLTVIEQSAFQMCPLLDTVNLPVTIRHVGAFCFESCARLSNVMLNRASPMLVVEASCYLHARNLEVAPITTNLISIQQDAFRSSGLVVVDLSSTRVSCIADRAFSHCTRLTKFTASHALMALGTQVFADCTQLEHVDLSGARGLTFAPPGCFDNCASLSHVALPVGMRSIRENCFRNCRNLTNITLPPTVGSIGSLAFANTKNLHAIRITGVSLPELSVSALKHSGAVIISRHTNTPALSPAVVAVPANLATNSQSFVATLLALRLANADHHRERLRQHVKRNRTTVSNVDVTRERRHRKHFATMPVLPFELWQMILQHNTPWPSKLPAVYYFPRLLHKPSTLVWKRWFAGCHAKTAKTGGLPPLLTFLFDHCTHSDIKLLAHHTWANQRPRQKGTLLATHIYIFASCSFPKCMTHYNHDKQLRIVKLFKTVLKQSSKTKEQFMHLLMEKWLDDV